MIKNKHTETHFIGENKANITICVNLKSRYLENHCNIVFETKYKKACVNDEIL